MILFSSKIDPIIKTKHKEKNDKAIPAIILLKNSPSSRFKNSITKNKGKLKYEYKFINALALEIDYLGIDKLSESPEVYFISYDRKAEICMDKTQRAIGIDLITPYSLTGKGINIAIIDTGVYPHGDLNRPRKVILFFKDFINNFADLYDDNGHGTHLCGIISGSGALSGEKYKGIAPNSRIIMLKAFNSVGEGSFSDILAAIEWCIFNKDKYNIKILCLPFGSESIVQHRLDPLSIACEAAWNAGLIVVAASGNKGPHYGTITTPGICPSIITVGCLDCRDDNKNNWKIPEFSGRGTKKDIEIKPDILAPGVNITSLSSDKTYIPGFSKLTPLDMPYCSMSGSSIACAVATGCIALLLEKMPSVKGNDLKGMLRLSCKSLNEPKTSQGFGIINMQKLFE